METRAPQLLRHFGIKQTRPRLAMLRALMEAEGPLTHDALEQRLKPQRVNRVTIYRVLDCFLEAGLVHRIDAGDRQWRFALCACGTAGHCHPHFICRLCGRVDCLPGMDLPSADAAPGGYRVEAQEYYLRGLCPQCIEDNKNGL